MDLVLVCKGTLESLPPVVLVASGLARLGLTVKVVVSHAGPSAVSQLQQQGIQVVQLHETQSPPKTILGKIRCWRAFGRRAWQALDAAGHGLLWVGSADTALALGRRLLAQRYVLQIHELYDRFPFYRYGLGRYARQAQCVVVPEACRAAIFRCWYGLSRTPFVLPNTLLDHPRVRDLPISDPAARRIVDFLQGKKVLLYQGHICPGRDLAPLAAAVREMSDEYHLLLMGLDRHGLVAQLAALCKRISHIPYITPPEHLTVTSHAHIGLITYDYDSLNSVFCAPNKVWEYAGFGLPMLCRSLPGLQSTAGVAQAGICTDFDDTATILAGVKEIEERYSQFSTNSRAFYESVDALGLLQRILGHLADKRGSPEAADQGHRGASTDLSPPPPVEKRA